MGKKTRKTLNYVVVAQSAKLLKLEGQVLENFNSLLASDFLQRKRSQIHEAFLLLLVSRYRQPRETFDLETLNLELASWLALVANARQHGTTNEVPQTRLMEEQNTYCLYRHMISAALAALAKPKLSPTRPIVKNRYNTIYLFTNLCWSQHEPTKRPASISV